jgi:hypothetical protein
MDPAQPLHDYFVERYERVRRFYQGVLERDRDRGRIRADVDVEAIATEILSFTMGVEMQWLAGPDRVDLADAIDNYIGRLLRALAPRGRTRST